MTSSSSSHALEIDGGGRPALSPRAIFKGSSKDPWIENRFGPIELAGDMSSLKENTAGKACGLTALPFMTACSLLRLVVSIPATLPARVVS